MSGMPGESDQKWYFPQAGSQGNGDKPFALLADLMYGTSWLKQKANHKWLAFKYLSIAGAS